MQPRRPSYEILKDAFDKVGFKPVAYQLGVNQSLVYKWAAVPDNAEELFGAANGRINPLDRTQDILRLLVTAGHHDLATEIIDWLARELGGAFISSEQMQAISQVANALTNGSEQPKMRRAK